MRRSTTLAAILSSVLVAVAIFAAPASAFETKPFTDTAFKAAQAGGQPILINVFAPWCPTCKVQHKVFEQLKSKPEFSGITSLQVDFDNQPDALKMLNASRQSTIIAFKGERETGRAVGLTDAQMIEDLLLSTLK